MVPAALFAVLLIGYDHYHRERERLVRDSTVTARALLAAVDTELSGVKAALRALSTSPYLSSLDLAAFYRQAQTALKDQSFFNIVLADDSGRQLINTARRFGEPLPAQDKPGQLQRVFETGEPVISDLFVGPVLQRHVIAVGVPVFREGKIRYALSGGVDAQKLSALLIDQRLPPGWIAGVFDAQGTIVARTHDAERLVGQKGSAALLPRMKEVNEDALESHTVEGIPVLKVFTRSTVSNWSVAIGIPQTELTAHLWYSLARLFVAAFVALLVALGLAALFSRRLMR